jgi:hypothetical protein
MAIADFTQAITIDPQDTNSYLVRGLVYYFDNQYAEALADWNRVEALGAVLPAKFEQYRTEAEAALTQTPTPIVTATAIATK